MREIESNIQKVQEERIAKFRNYSNQNLKLKVFFKWFKYYKKQKARKVKHI